MRLSRTLLISASALVAAGAITTAAGQAQEARAPMGQMAGHGPVRTISVTGTGSVSARPDMASVTFSVEARGNTANEALEANSRRMREAMAALKRAGIEERDLQTTGLYLNTVNRVDDNGRWTDQVSPYEATNSLVARVRDIDETGAVIDAAVKAGINGLGGIQFGFADDAALMDEARKKAVENARSKAALYAAAAGVSLGELILITEPGSSAGPQPMYRMAMDAAEMAPPPPVAAGETSVSASVTLVWAIK